VRVEIRTRELAAVAAGLLLAVLIPGIWFWQKTGAHFGKCVYADPTCSLTVSTYLLCCLTLGAFLAAYRASRLAFQALHIERSVIIAVENCYVPGVQTTSTSNVANPEQHGALRLEERYMHDVEVGFESTRPADFTSDYAQVNFDCVSVGRSPVVMCSIGVKCTIGGDSKERVVDVGSIPTNAFIHLRLWFDSSTSDIEFEWMEKTVKHKAESEIMGFFRDERILVPRRSVATTPEPPVSKANVVDLSK